MKNQVNHADFKSYFDLLSKIPMRMRLTALSLFCIFLQVHAMSSYSQTTKLTLDLKNVSVENVLDKIEENTEFYFLYNSKLINVDRIVNVKAKSKSIETVLAEVFADTDVIYKIEDRQIILSKAEYIALNPQQQPNKRIRGTVFDTTGDPVIGVNIRLKGSANTGTITDLDGQFSLEVPQNAVLLISYIGYMPQEVIVGNQSELTIRLLEDTQALDEVVVVGYGTQKKVNLTGSVSSISASEISSIPVSNISNAMAGRMPGVFSFNSSGLPGASSPVIIRGVNTPNNTNPTYVIDGVVRDKADFDALDPNEIESFSVLKDAASAAVYGSRAANGVILLTTKRGADQKPMFRYTAMVGTERETRRPKIMSAYDRTQYLNNQFGYNGVNPTSTNYYTPDEVDWFRTHDYDRLEMAWQNPLIHQHNLSVNGGSDKIRYFLSVGYYDQKGVFEKVKYTKYNFRSNVDAKINDNFSISFNVDANTNKMSTPYWPHNGSGTNDYGVEDNYVIKDLYRALMNHPRTENPYINGKPNATIYGWNVLEVIRSGGSDVTDRNTLNAKISGTYKIPYVEGLSATAMFNYRRFYSVRKQVGKEYPLYEHETSGTNGHIIRDDAQITRTKYRSETLGNGVRKDFDENSRYTLNLQLNYDRSFGKHDIGALFLYEQYEESQQDIFAQRKKLLTNAIEELYIGDGDAANKDAGGKATEFGRLGYIGRINYAYASKYLLEANFRYDASVRFPKGDRWGFFPSFSAGWRMAEEGFIKENENLQFINNLKIRASYGILGNDQVDPYQYLDLFTTDTGGAFGSATTGIKPGVYPNKKITWEKTATTNVGFDVGLWNGLLSFEFDYFHKRTYDILLKRERTVPSTFGATLPTENYAELINKGVDLLVRHDNRIGGIKYYITGNFSFARNHYSKIDEAENAYDYQLKTGRPMHFITGYQANGIARTEADLAGLPTWNTAHNWQLGDIMLRDLNGDGDVTSADQAILSKYSKNPEIVYGFSLGGEWKGFDLNIFFQGVAHRSIMPEFRSWKWTEQSVLDIWSDAYSNKSFAPDNPYMTDNLNGKYPRVGGTGSVAANNQASSFWLLNGNYLRLKNLEIGYTIPKTLLRKIGVEGLRVYASGTNLFVLDHVDIYDPENSSNWDAYQYPLMKSYNVGLSLTF